MVSSSREGLKRASAGTDEVDDLVAEMLARAAPRGRAGEGKDAGAEGLRGEGRRRGRRLFHPRGWRAAERKELKGACWARVARLIEGAKEMSSKWRAMAGQPIPVRERRRMSSSVSRSISGDENRGGGSGGQLEPPRWREANRRDRPGRRLYRWRERPIFAQARRRATR